MKRCWLIRLGLLSASLFFFSLANAAEMGAVGGDMPPPDGKQLWKYITETNPYKGWGYWPTHYGMYPGKAPHGAYLVLYANSLALKAAREGKPMPYGAILVKENYDSDKETLLSITPMYKVKGYNPEQGDLFWAKYEPDGKIDKEGKPAGCINCHEAAKDTGWIFAPTK